MISGDHTILNSGSAIGQDVFPFKTSISMLIGSSPLRLAHSLNTRLADGKSSISMPNCTKFEARNHR
jgi:hypothetical protein